MVKSPRRDPFLISCTQPRMMIVMLMLALVHPLVPQVRVLAALVACWPVLAQNAASLRGVCGPTHGRRVCPHASKISSQALDRRPPASEFRQAVLEQAQRQQRFRLAEAKAHLARWGTATHQVISHHRVT